MLFHLWANLEAECLRSGAAISRWSRYGLDYGLWSDPATPDHFIWLTIMLLQATIVSNYFVKTQTYVASFGPSGLSRIF